VGTGHNVQPGNLVPQPGMNVLKEMAVSGNELRTCLSVVPIWFHEGVFAERGDALLVVRERGAFLWDRWIGGAEVTGTRAEDNEGRRRKQ